MLFSIAIKSVLFCTFVAVIYKLTCGCWQIKEIDSICIYMTSIKIPSINLLMQICHQIFKNEG